MPHSAFTDSFIELTAKDKQLLLKLARNSIIAAANEDTFTREDSSEYPPALQQDAACFVTLTQGDQLRGCIGSLEARQPLYMDVIDNAQSSAIRDPRFLPLGRDEIDKTHIEISVLSPIEPIHFSSEDDLLEQINPFEDGLLLEEGRYRGTFLPLVWDKIPDKNIFLQELKVKAGLSRNYWSDTLNVSRYRTIIFEE